MHPSPGRSRARDYEEAARREPVTAVQKTFGVLILLLGALFLIAGVAAALYGAMDAQDHEQEQGPLGIGEDQERTETNQALIAGGLVAAGLGFTLSIVGLVLLVAARPKQRQQQQVVVTSTDASAAPAKTVQHQREGRRQPLVVSAVAAVALLGLVALGIALTGGGGVLGGEDGPRLLERRAEDGGLFMAGTLAGRSQNAYQWDLTAPDGTRLVRAVLDWEPANDQSAQLRITVQVQDGTAWRNLDSKTVFPGGVIDATAGTVGELDAARIRIVVAPIEQTFVVDQPFTVDVAFYS